MAKETLNPFEIAQKQIKSACDKLNADPAVYEILKNPMRVLEVSFPVKLDDGTVRIWRISCKNRSHWIRSSFNS